MADGIVPPKSMFSLFWRMGGWIALIFLLPFAILTGISNHVQKLAWEFDADAQQTVATVINKYTTVSTDSDGDKSTTYWLDLTYPVDGRTIANQTSVATKIWNRYEPKDTLTIHYLPRDPTVIEVTRGTNQTGATITLVLSTLFGALFLVAFFIPANWTASAVAARRHGRLVPATVTGLERTNVTVNNRPRYRLAWRDDEGGTGTSMMARHSALSRYAPGTRIDVYQHRGKSWWRNDIGDAPARKRSRSIRQD